MNIYLLRHGETDWNLEGRLQGHEDIGMNQNGINQIEKAAEVLAGCMQNVDVIISSPLSRARKSAEIVAGRLDYKKEDIVTDPLFIEEVLDWVKVWIMRRERKDLLMIYIREWSRWKSLLDVLDWHFIIF